MYAWAIKSREMLKINRVEKHYKDTLQHYKAIEPACSFESFEKPPSEVAWFIYLHAEYLEPD